MTQKPRRRVASTSLKYSRTCADVFKSFRQSPLERIIHRLTVMPRKVCSTAAALHNDILRRNRRAACPATFAAAVLRARLSVKLLRGNQQEKYAGTPVKTRKLVVKASYESSSTRFLLAPPAAPSLSATIRFSSTSPVVSPRSSLPCKCAPSRRLRAHVCFSATSHDQRVAPSHHQSHKRHVNGR